MTSRKNSFIKVKESLFLKDFEIINWKKGIVVSKRDKIKSGNKLVSIIDDLKISINTIKDRNRDLKIPEELD